MKPVAIMFESMLGTFAGIGIVMTLGPVGIALAGVVFAGHVWAINYLVNIDIKNAVERTKQ